MLRALPSLGGSMGQAPPINICNSSPLSLLPKLLPGHLSQAPESAVELAVWTGPLVSMCIYNEFQVYICKEIFFKYTCLFTISQIVIFSCPQRPGPRRGWGAGELGEAASLFQEHLADASSDPVQGRWTWLSPV